MYCKRCSQQVPDDADYCPFCQEDLREVRRLTPSSSTPPPGTPPGSFDSLSDKATVGVNLNIAELPAGAVIAARYEVVRLLGKGGMGAVYEVQDRDLGARCALKLMHPHLLSSERAVERFVQEARVSLELAHPNIIRVRDTGRESTLRYLTMELLEGQSLREWLDALEAVGRTAPLEVVVSITSQVLEALAYAHKHTIHRDIKPENIFLLGDEKQFRIKVLDFGIAKALDRDALTSTSSSMGTAWYVAPEQLKGARDVDGRADLFAVGAVLFELLTGGLPHGHLHPPSELREDVTTAWDELVFGAMEAERDHRPASARAFLDTLASLETKQQLREAEQQRLAEQAQQAKEAEDRRKREEGARRAAMGGRAGEQKTVRIGSQTIQLRWIPPGEVRMGSPSSEACRGSDETQWTAKISRGFWMGETEVTQGLWREVMGNNPSHFSNCGTNCPVEMVSWDDIQKFLRKLNRKASGGEFRLPTEAEWEYSARAGTASPFGISCPGYSSSNCKKEVSCLNRIGWYYENSGRKTHPVGQKQANAWGLHDMHGNVWEWCQDWYGDYPQGTHVDYTGPRDGAGRVLRGGSWGVYARVLRSASRDWYRPGFRNVDYGFRVVWVLPASQGAH